MKSVRLRKFDLGKVHGSVALVGAGPGDPNLLTLGAKALLESCDVVVYDHLVHSNVLALANGAERIYAGKQPTGRNSTTQASIQRLLVRLARSGKRVVRLKGGDPFVFGRGGEEALWLRKHHVPFEVVPGVTAGIAVPAYAGIPLTHRGVASDVVFITAHEDPAKAQKNVDWKIVAGFRGTVVLYMGLATLRRSARALIRFGKNPDTPVSVIGDGTTVRQKVISATLGTVSELIKGADVAPPTLIVIGNVNRFREHMNWFSNKPLFGKRILVTRAAHQALTLVSALHAEGAETVELPTIRIAPLKHYRTLDRTVGRLRRFDWIVFTSENGVQVFFKRLETLGKDARALSHSKIAAIGSQTGNRLKAFGIKADLLPRVFTSKGLLEALKGGQIEGKRFLLLRADIAPPDFRRALSKRGAIVRETAVYRTQKPKGLAKRLERLFCGEPFDFITFTSSSTVVNFFRALGRRGTGGAKIISIGPVTSKTIREMGGFVSREAKVHDARGLVQAILEEVRSEVSGPQDAPHARE